MIIPYYREYAADVNAMVSKQAITSIGSIALRLPELAQTCVKKLLSLLSYGISCMTSNVLVCLTSKHCGLRLSLCVVFNYLPIVDMEVPIVCLKYVVP